MWELFFKAWYLAAILPMLIFLEANDKFAAYLKKRGIYAHWDKLHSLIIVLVVVLIIYLIYGGK